MYLKSFLTFVALLEMATAQNIVATSGRDQVTLASSNALVTFVASGAGSAAEAVKGAAISSAEGQAVAATAAHMVPIPIVGSLAAPVVGTIFAKFHHPKATTGFAVAFVKGVTGAQMLPAGAASFTAPAQSVPPRASLLLLRARPSLKDNMRIIRSNHVAVKAGGNIAPGSDIDILGVDQEMVPCHQMMRDGTVTLTTDAPLEMGEYAVVLVPERPEALVPAALVWDFRIF